MPNPRDGESPEQGRPSRTPNLDLMDSYAKYMAKGLANGRRPRPLVFNPKTTSLPEAISASKVRKPTL